MGVEVIDKMSPVERDLIYRQLIEIKNKESEDASSSHST